MLGWEPKIVLRDGLNLMVDDFRKCALPFFLPRPSCLSFLLCALACAPHYVPAFGAGVGGGGEGRPDAHARSHSHRSARCRNPPLLLHRRLHLEGGTNGTA